MDGQKKGREEGGLAYLGDSREALVRSKALSLERNPLVELAGPHVEVHLRGGREGGREGGRVETWREERREERREGGREGGR